MADAADSKSVYGDIVRVQVPPPAFKIPYKINYIIFLYSISKQTVLLYRVRYSILYFRDMQAHVFFYSIGKLLSYRIKIWLCALARRVLPDGSVYE